MSAVVPVDLRLKLPVFEGPLDLLLHLVRSNELDVSEIRIVEITGQYLSYLRIMETLDLELAGEFLVMAATLVNMKARALLPDQALDAKGEEEDDDEVGDITTASALLEKLVEYRRFKEASTRLREGEERQTRLFFREVALPRMAEAREDDELRGDLDKMLQSFARVLRFVDARGWHMVVEEEFSIEDKIERLQTRLRIESRIEIEPVFQACSCKIEAIVTLVALLELCKQKLIRIEQPETYGPVVIHRRDPEEVERLRRNEASGEQVSADPEMDRDRPLGRREARILELRRVREAAAGAKPASGDAARVEDAASPTREVGAERDDPDPEDAHDDEYDEDEDDFEEDDLDDEDDLDEDDIDDEDLEDDDEDDDFDDDECDEDDEADVEDDDEDASPDPDAPTDDRR